jgi:hypothetical protein
LRRPKRQAYERHAYLPRIDWDQFSDEARSLARLSQKAQLRVSELRRAEQFARHEQYEAQRLAEEGRRDTLARLFMRVSQKLLSESQFQRVMDEA